MKNKVVAGFLALFFNVLSIHKFYLEESGAGIFRIGLFVFAAIADWPFVAVMLAIVSFVEAILLFSMTQQEFDEKYNQKSAKKGKKKERYAQAPQTRDARQYRRQQRGASRTATLHNPHKKRGVEYYKDYDYVSAINEFKKALEVQEEDIATHFNIACAYSLTENKKEALYHLDQAIKLGFSDFDKIRTKDAFAYLRIQPEYEVFERNNFRISTNGEEPSVKQEIPQLQSPQKSLLDDEFTLKKLERLGELRDRNIITPEEFDSEKERLLSNR